MKFILYGLVGILVIDFAGFMFWIYSGQFPLGEVYVGTITTHFIKLFI